MDDYRKGLRERVRRVMNGESPASPLYQAYSAMTSQQQDSVAGSRMYYKGVDLLEALEERLQGEISKKDEKIREKTNEVRRLKTQHSKLLDQIDAKDSAAKEELDRERDKIRDLRTALSSSKTEATRQITAAQQRVREVIEASELSEDTTALLRKVNDLTAEAETERASRIRLQAALDEVGGQLEAAERKAELKSPEVAVEGQSVRYRFKPRKTSHEASVGDQGFWTLAELQSVLTHLTVNGAEDDTIVRISAKSFDADVVSDGLPPQPWARPRKK